MFPIDQSLNTVYYTLCNLATTDVLLFTLYTSSFCDSFGMPSSSICLDNTFICTALLRASYSSSLSTHQYLQHLFIPRLPTPLLCPSLPRLRATFGRVLPLCLFKNIIKSAMVYNLSQDFVNDLNDLPE